MLRPAVVLVGGFGAPSILLTPLRQRLRAAGMTVEVAPTGLTLDCGEVEVARVRRTAAEAGRRGAPVVLVGHSRGGQLALVAAARDPGVTRGVVTVGTPSAIGVPDRPAARAGAWVAIRAQGLGIPTLGSLACGSGPCCERFRADLAGPAPVPWAALWSPHDRLVPPRDALLGAWRVQIKGGHAALVLWPSNHDVIAATVDELATGQGG